MRGGRRFSQRLTGPVTLYQVTSFELLHRAGSSVTLGMKVEQLTPKQTMVLPEPPPGVTVDVSAEVASIAHGDGEITLDLHSPVPRSRASIDAMLSVGRTVMWLFLARSLFSASSR